MLENKTIKKILCIELLVLLCWSVIVLVFTEYDKAGFYFWGGFCFGIISFVIAGISLLLISPHDNPSLAEINYISLFCTIAYLTSSIVVNTYFVVRCSGKFNIILAVFNAAILILFVGIRLYTDKPKERVNQQTLHSIRKVRQSTLISSKLATLLCITSDLDIKERLIKAKELVEYSPNVSQDFSEELENLFLLHLNQIESMICENKDREEIVRKIESAIMVWNQRNSVISTMK